MNKKLLISLLLLELAVNCAQVSRDGQKMSQIKSSPDNVQKLTSNKHNVSNTIFEYLKIDDSCPKKLIESLQEILSYRSFSKECSELLENENIIEYIKKKKIKVEVADEHDNTALNLVIRNRQFNFIDILLPCYNSIEKLDQILSNELRMASHCNDLDIIQEMLSRNLISKKNKDVALAIAIYRGNIHLLRNLIKAGANVNSEIESIEYSSPLCFAVSCALMRPKLIDIYYEIAEELLKNKANPNFLFNGGSVLRYAMLLPNSKMAELLLKYGANSNEIIADECNLLTHSVDEEEFELAKLLVRYGADLNYTFQRENGQSANPMIALLMSKKVNPEFLEYLLKQGVDIESNIKKCKEENIEDALKNIKSSKVKKFIKSQKALADSQKKIFEAYNDCKTDVFKKFLKQLQKNMPSRRYLQNLFLLLKDENGNTLLHKAVMKNDYDLIHYILKYNHKIATDLMYTPNNDNVTVIDLSVKDEQLLKYFMEIAYMPAAADDKCVIS